MPLFLSHPFIEGSSKHKIGFSAGSANYIITAGALFRLSESFELLPSILLISAVALAFQGCAPTNEFVQPPPPGPLARPIAQRAAADSHR